MLSSVFRRVEKKGEVRDYKPSVSLLETDKC